MDPLDTLSAAESALLAAICAGPPAALPLAWSGRARLEADGHAPETIDGLVVAGWLVLWELAEGVQVTLTPLAAYRLRVELEERGLDELPTWQEMESGRKPRPIRLPHEPGRQPLLDLHPARQSDPEPEDEVMRDPWTGQPILLFGQVIRRQARKRKTA